MGLFSRIKRKEEGPGSTDRGLLLFDTANDALCAERTLRDAGYEVTLVAPPHELRTGCDLALAISNIEHLGALRALDEAHTPARRWVDSDTGTLSLVDLVTTVDLGDWLMVRAGNMKIVFDKSTHIIVNTSGGGCPDIPYLNLELTGKTLEEAPRPRDLGYTLCGLMLDRAFLEALSIASAQEVRS